MKLVVIVEIDVDPNIDIAWDAEVEQALEARDSIYEAKVKSIE